MPTVRADPSFTESFPGEGTNLGSQPRAAARGEACAGREGGKGNFMACVKGMRKNITPRLDYD